MRLRTLDAPQDHRRCGSILLVVLGVLGVLTLIGVSFVLFAGTGQKAARNYHFGAQAELLVEQEIERLKSLLVADWYPHTPPASGVAWRMLNESRDFPDSADGWLFGWRGDGSGILQVSFGGSGATPEVNNDARDSEPDSIWRQFTLSDGNIARVATLVLDHAGFANVNVWGNIQDPTTGCHNTHQGLGVYELNLMRVLGLDPTATDQRDTYRALFLGRQVDGRNYPGRYGFGAGVEPGDGGVDDDGDSGRWQNHLDDDVDDSVDEAGENIDEPSEYCYSHPGGTGNDTDRPFDIVDQWELLRNRSFLSRLEVLLTGFDLDAPFDTDADTLGSFRQNLTTLSADPEWVGVGAADTYDRLTLRLDLNYASASDLERAFRQAGFSPVAAKQMAVNIVDYRDTDNDVTAIDDHYGHERQPYINEFFVGIRKLGGSLTTLRAVAIELHNPYDTDINVYNWELRIDLEGDTPSSHVVVLDDGSANPSQTTVVPANGYLTIVSVDPPVGGESFVFNPTIQGKTIVLERPIPPDPPAGKYALPWPLDNHVYRIRLVRALKVGDRPDPADPSKDELVVDDTGSEINFTPPLRVPKFPPVPALEGYLHEDLHRPDAEVNDFVGPYAGMPNHTLGRWNDPSKPVLHSVPIPNRGRDTFGSVGDLGEVLSETQNGNAPYTDDYAASIPAELERGIKFDFTGDWYAGGGNNAHRNVLDLFCVNRPDHDGLDNDGDGSVDEPDEADWPVFGRININTASLPVLARALSNGPYSKTEASVLASRIVAHRETVGAFRQIGDLFRSSALAQVMAYFADGDGGQDDDGDGLAGEKDERDARFRYLANMITTRSNVFTVFITVEIRDPDRGELLASRRAVAVLDRSRAGMSVRFQGTTPVYYVEEPVIEREFRWLSE